MWTGQTTAYITGHNFLNVTLPLPREGEGEGGASAPLLLCGWGSGMEAGGVSGPPSLATTPGVFLSPTLIACTIPSRVGGGGGAGGGA